MTKVLVVIDMQNDFISGTLGSEAARGIVPEVVNLIEGWNGKIVATLDTHGTPEEYALTLEGKNLPVYHCGRNTEGWALQDNVRDALKANKGFAGTIEKPTFGCVALPDFIRKILGEENPENVEFTVVGLDTDICVVSNALLLRANFPDSAIRVLSSCCAGSSSENHAAALHTMRSCQIVVE